MCPSELIHFFNLYTHRGRGNREGGGKQRRVQGEREGEEGEKDKTGEGKGGEGGRKGDGEREEVGKRGKEELKEGKRDRIQEEREEERAVEIDKKGRKGGQRIWLLVEDKRSDNFKIPCLA